jgi:hypothetical protein
MPTKRTADCLQSGVKSKQVSVIGLVALDLAKPGTPDSTRPSEQPTLQSKLQLVTVTSLNTIDRVPSIACVSQ